MKMYRCNLNKKMCKYGGNKSYNYGFMQVTYGYCYKIKDWTHDMSTCPVEEEFDKRDQKDDLTMEHPQI